MAHIQIMSCSTNSLGPWIGMEHYRFHCAEQWPDGPHRDAVLAAIYSTLQRLEAAAADVPAACMVCARRKTLAPVIMFPSRPKSSSAALPSAA
jgi:hypothetical protein